MPGDELLELEASIPAGPFARAFVRRYDQLSEHYALSFRRRGSGCRSARHAPCSCAPGDQHRFGYRMWLDAGIRHVAEVRVVERRTASGWRFSSSPTSSSADEVPDSALESQAASGSMASHLRLSPRTRMPRQRRHRQPLAGRRAGSRLALPCPPRKSGATPANDNSVSTMMYSDDGLAAFYVVCRKHAEHRRQSHGSPATVQRWRSTQLVDGPDGQPHGHHVGR